MSRPSPQTSRVIALLELMAAESDQAFTLAAVSRRLGVHRATCHSMLNTLAAAGWLLRDPTRKTYQLGPALMPIGDAATKRFPALEFARPAMIELTHATGAHCVAFLAEGDHLTVIAQIRAVLGAGTPMPLGTEFPLHPPYGTSTATWGSDEDRESWLAETPDDRRQAHREAFAAARRRGYAVGLHVLPEARLQELAALVRAADIGRKTPAPLEQLARQLTDELMRQEEWHPAALDDDATYEVSHVDAPVFDRHARLCLMLSLVPVSKTMSGRRIDEIGRLLVATTQSLTAAIGGVEPGAVPLQGEP